MMIKSTPKQMYRERTLLTQKCNHNNAIKFQMTEQHFVELFLFFNTFTLIYFRYMCRGFSEGRDGLHQTSRCYWRVVETRPMTTQELLIWAGTNSGATNGGPCPV